MNETGQEFEFNPEQDKLIGALAGKMRGVGQFFMFLGVLLLLHGFLQIREGGIGAIISGLIYLGIGNWTVNASAAFRVIVDTKGSDMRLLMDALENLKKVYSLMYILILVGLLAVLVFLFLALYLVWMTRA